VKVANNEHGARYDAYRARRIMLDRAPATRTIIYLFSERRRELGLRVRIFTHAPALFWPVAHQSFFRHRIDRTVSGRMLDARAESALNRRQRRYCANSAYHRGADAAASALTKRRALNKINDRHIIYLPHA